MDRSGVRGEGGKGARNSRVYAPTRKRPGTRGAKPQELEAPITKRTKDRYELARASWQEAPAARKPSKDKPRPAGAKPKKKAGRRGRQETVLVPIALLGLGQSAAREQHNAGAAQNEAQAAAQKQAAREKPLRAAKRKASGHSGAQRTRFSQKNPTGKQDKPKREKRPPMSGKKALSIAACIVAFIGLLFAGYFVFLLDEVIVGGYETYSPAQIVELSGLVKDRHMLLINPEAVKRNIGENPYIEVLSVEKELPRTIRIQVAERKEAAVIRNQGYDVIMDIKGHVLSIGASSRLDGLLHIYGMSQQGFQVNKPIGANEDIQTDTLRTILYQLDTLGLAGDVQELNLSNPLRVTMRTTQGVTIDLGQAGDMEGKLMWMRDTLPSLLASGVTSGTLDVSAKGGPIYSPEGARQLGSARGEAAVLGDDAQAGGQPTGDGEPSDDEGAEAALNTGDDAFEGQDAE